MVNEPKESDSSREGREAAGSVVVDMLVDIMVLGVYLK